MKNLLERLKGKLKSVPKLVYGIVAALVTFIVVMLVMIFTPLNNGDNGSSNSSYVKEINHSGNEKKKEKEDTTKKADEKKNEEKKSDEKKDDTKVAEDKKTSEEKTNTESVTNTENTSVTNQPSENAANNNVVEQPSVQKEKKPIYQTVHYDATGHWETQIVQEAYDDPQFEERVVGISSGHIYNSVSDFINNRDLYGDGNYTVTEVQVGSVHHDAVTTQVWVEDSPAHDEQVLVGWE